VKVRLFFAFVCVISALFLAAFGLVGISAATQPGYEFSSFFTDSVRKQVFAFAAGLIIGLVVLYIGFSYLLRIAPYLGGISLALLVLTLIIGHETYGAQRWISLGFFQFQPSELAKLTLPLFLVWISAHFSGWRKWVVSTLVALCFIGLVIIQPDLGTSIVLLTEFLGFLVVDGINWGVLFSGVYALILMFPVLWEKGLRDYQRRRLLSFLNPYDDPTKDGYNLIQAWTAIGAGGLRGKGLQDAFFLYYGYLPVDYADFIFATIAYVLGFWGALAVIILVCTFLLGGLGYAFFVPNQIQQKFCFMALCAWAVQFVINIGMNLGLMPITGIPLPFISYGGSAILMNTVMLFVFLSYRPEPEAHETH
jgi:rod shape determining protein RodA